jgi:four helix bundle suffix protein
LKASHVKWQTSQTVHQTNYLIDQQLRRLEQDFIKDGGLRERMLAGKEEPERIK